MPNISVSHLSHNILVNPSVLYQENSLNVNKPIAIRLTINPKSQMASWEDTTRGHSIHVKEYTIKDNEVVIISKDNHTWTFVPLTRQIFNKIKKDLIPINKEFESDQELQTYYSQASFY